MALDDILIPEGDIQNPIMEIPGGVLNTPSDILSDSDMSEIPNKNTYPKSRVVNN